MEIRATFHPPIVKPFPVLMLASLLAATAIGTSHVSAETKAAAKPALNEAGNKLLAKYADLLKASQAEVSKVIPNVNEQSKTAFQKAREAIKGAEAAVTTAQQPLGKIQEAKALVEHAKGKWIGGAEKGIAKAEADLKKATTDAEREAARKEIAKWQANKEDGIKALKERQAALDKATADESKVKQANQVAQAALNQAQANETAAAKVMLAATEPFLSNDKLDAQLMRAAILTNATPAGLAEFGQQGKEQESMVDKLLSDVPLMKQMLEAGGAQNGKYGQAIQIYARILKASPKAKDGVLQRLALATSLEHAVPIAQSNPKDQPNAPATVDPVKRYQHYEKAYLAGELDAMFKNFSTWEYRMIVQCDAPDEILAWGREMLRNYRPDYVTTPDYGWRYSVLVKSDCLYGSQDVDKDLPELQNYQNIVKNGGVCGRRAFFGRFILSSFGIPTWGVTQHKHAAVGRWTPKGWVVNLGAGFQHSWWDKDEAPRSGSDFLLETQARVVPQDFMKVLRAQWVSDVLNEQDYNERKGVPGGFWSALAHYQSMAIATATKAVALAPVGQDVAESNDSKEKTPTEQAKVSDADQKLAVGKDGVITIPAVLCSKANGVTAMKSSGSGMQLHLTRDLNAPHKFECTFDAPQAGKYAFAAQVVTIQSDQKLLLAANDAKAPVEIAVPYTVGKWQATKPVEVVLTKGRNTLHFTHPAPNRGVTIKQFALTPVK